LRERIGEEAFGRFMDQTKGFDARREAVEVNRQAKYDLARKNLQSSTEWMTMPDTKKRLALDQLRREYGYGTGDPLE
jgi:hypothetical protein